MSFVANQYVWSCDYGHGIVTEIANENFSYPVFVKFNSGKVVHYTPDGRRALEYLKPTLFAAEVINWPAPVRDMIIMGITRPAWLLPKWQWMSRDIDGGVRIHADRPVRLPVCWNSDETMKLDGAVDLSWVPSSRLADWPCLLWRFVD